MAKSTAAKTEQVLLGKNVRTHVESGILTIQIDLNAPRLPIKEGGKMQMLGQTSGFVDVPDTDGLRLNLNIGSKL